MLRGARWGGLSASDLSEQIPTCCVFGLSKPRWAGLLLWWSHDRNIRFLPGPSPAVQKTRRGRAWQKRSRVLAALGTSLGGVVASPAARRRRRRNRPKSQIRASNIYKAAPRRLGWPFPRRTHSMANAPAFSCPAKCARSLSVEVPVWIANDDAIRAWCLPPRWPDTQTRARRNWSSRYRASVKYRTNFNALRTRRPLLRSIYSHNQGLSATIVDTGEQMKLPLFALSFITAAVVSLCRRSPKLSLVFDGGFGRWNPQLRIRQSWTVYRQSQRRRRYVHPK